MPPTVPERTAGVRVRTKIEAKSSKAGGISPKRSKYGAVPTTVDGRRFPSKREAARYQVLAAAQRAGYISDLQCQVPFDLHAPNGTKIGRYVADFAYTWIATDMAGLRHVEDAKGVRTPLYKWKKKHCEAEHGITIVEV